MDRGDPLKILERRQKRHAELIADKLLLLPPAARKNRLDAMSEDWRNEVEEAIKCLKQLREIT